MHVVSFHFLSFPFSFNVYLLTVALEGLFVWIQINRENGLDCCFFSNYITGTNQISLCNCINVETVKIHSHFKIFRLWQKVHDKFVRFEWNMHIYLACLARMFFNATIWNEYFLCALRMLHYILLYKITLKEFINIIIKIFNRNLFLCQLSIITGGFVCNICNEKFS